MSVVRHTYKLRRFRCGQCDGKAVGLFWDYDPSPVCADHGHMSEVPRAVSQTVMIATDSIPGGMLVPHVLCSEDGLTPGRVDSKSELRSRLAEKGWTIDGETPKVLQKHVDQRGVASEDAVRRAVRGYRE